MRLTVQSVRKISSATGRSLYSKFSRSAEVLKRPVPTLSRYSRNMAAFASRQLQYPDPIVIPAIGKHTATVFVFHGLGDTGDGWSFLPSMVHKDMKHVKFVFPTAPQRRITLNMGMTMTGWFDIMSLEKLQQEDREGLLESKRYVEDLVQQEVSAGIPSYRIIVAGFSQGGAVSLLMLRSSARLAGVVGLSTYLPLAKEKPIVSEPNKTTPVLMCHGDRDQVINYKYGVESYEMLKANGAKVELKTFNGMGHSACPEELEDLKNFLKTNLPPT